LYSGKAARLLDLHLPATIACVAQRTWVDSMMIG
jgi:hypothetical protein